MENKSLGSLIREERIRKKLTQEQLGKMVGLKAPRISKIENGAPITPEVASFILGKMGSTIQLSLADSKKYDDEKTSFVLLSILIFARKNKMKIRNAYSYLSAFKGIDFLKEHSDIEQTLSFNEINEDLLSVCHNNGGRL